MPLKAIGIDIGGTHTKLAVVFDDGEILEIDSISTAATSDPALYLEQLLDWVTRAAGKNKIAGIGLSAPGFLADDHRSIRYNPNTPALVGIDFFNLFERFGLPVFLEEDLNVPAVAEYHFGEFRGSRRLLTASIGTGFGAGFVMDGKVLAFSGGTVGDTGHIILEPGGPACTAGCLGCAEALIAIPGIERLAAMHKPGQTPPVKAREVINAVKAGEGWALEIIDQVGTWLGQWLASVSPIFLPTHILLCGGVAECGEPLRKSADIRYKQLTGPEYSNSIVAVSHFGGRAGVIGAAAPFLVQTRPGEDQ